MWRLQTRDKLPNYIQAQEVTGASVLALYASQSKEPTLGLASEPFLGPTNVRFWGGYQLSVLVAGNLWVHFIG